MRLLRLAAVLVVLLIGSAAVLLGAWSDTALADDDDDYDLGSAAPPTAIHASDTIRSV